MVGLRELSKRDIPTINKWRNDPQLISCLGAPFRYINEDVDYSWYESYMSNRNRAVRCAIVNDEDNILGIVSLTNVDFINQSAELSVMIGEDGDRNKGIGSFAVRTMVEHGFYNMNLHRIYLTALENNKRACHVYEKVGFKKEGLLRDATFKNGVYMNMYHYSIIREEYCVQNICGGVQTDNSLPIFCMEQIWDKNEQRSIMLECDTAFGKFILDRDIYPALIEKIHLLGLFFRAYNKFTLGYAALYANDYHDRCAYLTMIAVRSEFHERGIGRMLLEQCEAAAYQNGMISIRLEVNKQNKRAIGFYHHMGYSFFKEASNGSIYMNKMICGGTEIENERADLSG